MDLEAYSPDQRCHLVDISGVDPRTGRAYEHKAFVPPPLPERIELSSKAWMTVTETTHTLGKLSQAGAQVPNPRLLQSPAIRREAQSTSALEGTFAPFDAVMEADVNPSAISASPELREVRNYVSVAEDALEWVVQRDVTVGLLCELQRRLVLRTTSNSSEAGRIRSGPVVVGPEGSSIEGARFIPPPGGPALEASLQDWQQWISGEQSMPPIVAAALGHYQFECLHPFTDGNGRIGRLVIVLQLIRSGVLSHGLLSVSPWFERRRSEYQDHLLRVSTSGDFEPWIVFFCEGVRSRAEATIDQVRALLEYQAQLRELAREGKWRGAIIHLLDDLIGRPIQTASSIGVSYGVTPQQAYNIIERLLESKVFTEVTGRSYDRLYAAQRVLEIVQS